MRELGFEVDEAKDGADAIDFVKNSRFDLVVSDIRMPRVDGITLITYLRSISPDMPVLVVTACSDQLRGIAQFPNLDVINKPVLLEEIESKIRVLLEL